MTKDQIDGYTGAPAPRCGATVMGQQCRDTALVYVVLIGGDGTERNMGGYCRYDAGNIRYFAAKPGDRVEHRNIATGRVEYEGRFG